MNFNSLVNKLEVLEEARQSSVWLPGWQNILVSANKLQKKLRAEGINFPTPIYALARYALVIIDDVISGKIDSNVSKEELEDDLNKTFSGGELDDRLKEVDKVPLPYSVLRTKLLGITDQSVKDKINKVWTTSIAADLPIENWAMQQLSSSNKKMDHNSYKEKIPYLKSIVSDVFKGGDIEAVQKAKEQEKQAKKAAQQRDDRMDLNLIDTAEQGLESGLEDAMDDSEIWNDQLQGYIEDDVIKYIENIEDKITNPKQLKKLNDLRMLVIQALGQAESYIEFKYLLDSKNDPFFGNTDKQGTVLYSIWSKVVLPIFIKSVKAATADISKAPPPKARPTRSGIDTGGLRRGEEFKPRQIEQPGFGTPGEENEEEPITESKKPVVKFIANKDMKAKTYWQKMAQQEMYYR